MADWVARSAPPEIGRPHPVIAAMNAVGYDAATIGNHDLDYGVAGLVEALSAAHHPVVCANLVARLGARPAEDLTLLPPYALLDRAVVDGSGRPHRMRIGVIGFLPPQVLSWNARHLKDRIAARDIVEAARGWLPVLRDRGADLVIALAHSGIDDAEPAPMMENAALPLARVAGLDAIVAGHSHQVFPGPDLRRLAGIDAERGSLAGMPAVMAGFAGSHVGVLDLTLKPRAGGGWRVARHRSLALPISASCGGEGRALVDSAPAVLSTAARAHDAALDHIRQGVARSEGALHTFFALAAGCPALALIAAAQAEHVREALQGRPEARLPLLSAATPFKAGGRGGPRNFTFVPEGEVRRHHVDDLYPYQNVLTAIRLTGAEVRDWLERSAGIFARLAPGRADQELCQHDAPAYQFDAIHGLTYRIDPTRPARFPSIPGGHHDPAARRVVDLAWRGEAVDDAMSFVVVTNNYRLAGNGWQPGWSEDRIVLQSGVVARDVLGDHIARAGTIRPQARHWWSLTAPRGTGAVLQTSPDALPFLDEIAAYRPEPAGRTETGFLRLRLRF